MATFSERIAEAMNIRDVSQAMLCQMTGIPKSAMSQYIAGNFKPKSARLYLIAEALDVNEAWLMGYDIPMARVEQVISKEEIKKSDCAFNLIDACAVTESKGGGGDFQHLQVKDNKFYSLHVFSSDNREQLMQADSMLNYFHSIVNEHPEYIPLLHKVIHIFYTDSQAEMKIIEKLFADYNDHYEEMLEAAAKI